MSFLQNCIGGVAMLAPSSRKVQPLMVDEEDDDYDYDEVFLPLEASSEKRAARGRYCGWAAFLRRDSQRMMIISAPILDPDQLFVRSGKTDLGDRSRSDNSWQNRTTMVHPIQPKQRGESDTLAYAMNYSQKEHIYQNKPDLLLHGTQDLGNNARRRTSYGSPIVPRESHDIARMSGKEKRKSMSIGNLFRLGQNDVIYQNMNCDPKRMFDEEIQYNQENEQIAADQVTDNEFPCTEQLQDEVGNLDFKGTVWKYEETQYKRLLSTLSHDLDGMLRELNETSNGPQWKRSLSLQVTHDSKQPIRIVSRKMGVLEQELNVLSAALSDSELSSSASSEQYFSLEDQQNPNLSEVSYTPSPDLFQSLPRDLSSSYHRSHPSPVYHQQNTPSPHYHHYTGSAHHATSSAHNASSSSHVLPEPTYQNTPCTQFHQYIIDPSKNVQGSSHNAISPAHNVENSAYLLSDPSFQNTVSTVTITPAQHSISTSTNFSHHTTLGTFQANAPHKHVPIASSHPPIYGQNNDLHPETVGHTHHYHHSSTPPIWSHPSPRQDNNNENPGTFRDAFCQADPRDFGAVEADGRGFTREEVRRPQSEELPLQERLALTQSVWLQPQMTRAVAVNKLHTEDPGVFVIRQSSRPPCVALSVRVGSKPCIDHYLIEETGQGVKLENSYHVFSDPLTLVYYYASQLDELPVQLTLPLALMEADRTTLLLCQPGFWSSHPGSVEYNGGDVRTDPPTSPLAFTTMALSQPPTTTAPSSAMVFTSKTYVQQTQVTHTERSQTQYIHNNSSQYTHNRHSTAEPFSHLDSSPEVTHDLQDRDSSPQRDSRRLSLSQINHSNKSPFSCPESSLVTTIRSSPPCDSASLTSDPSLLNNYFGAAEETASEKEKNYFKPISDLLNDSNDTVKLEGEKEKDHHTHHVVQEWRSNDNIMPAQSVSNSYQNENVESDSHTTHVKVSLEEPSVEDIVKSIEKEIESLAAQQKFYSASSSTALDKIQPSHSDTAVGNGLHSHVDSVQDMNFLSTAPPVMFEHSSISNHTDLKKVETAPAVISTQYSSERVINPTMGIRNEPVVFRFDFSSENNVGVNRYLSAHVDGEPPLSAKTQYSSPAYAEPFDTLLEKGVSQTQGAIHVNDFIRQKVQNTLQQGQQRSDCPRPAAEKKAISSRTHTNSKRNHLCKAANVRPAGALDSSLTANPHYKVSLEEIPLTPNSLHSRNQSPCQKILSSKNHHTPVPPLSFDGIQHHGRPANHSKPPLHGTSHHHSNARKPKMQSKQPVPNTAVNHPPVQPQKAVQRQNSGCSQFPLGGNGGSSDCSTAEDVLSRLCPELIFSPIKSLTQKNVHRISDYDNCGSNLCRHLGRPVSSHRSGGTHYSQPWDSANLFKQLLAYKHAGKMQQPGDESDGQSMLGSDVACSTFEWRKKSKQVVTAERQTREEVREEDVDEHSDSSVDESMVKEPDLMEELLQSPVTPVSPWTPNHEYTPGGKVENYVSGLAEKAETMFGGHVKKFVKCTIDGRENNPHIVLRNVRQFMSGIKNYLVQQGEQELNEMIEIQRNRLEQHEFLNVDSIIESSLHKCVIKPLKHHLYTMLVTHYKEQGQLQQMADNIQYARAKTPQDLGIKSWLVPPGGETMESIHSALRQMQREYSPLKKLHHLLGAMHMLLNSLNFPDNVSTDSWETAASLPAEDLLPLLVYVLVQCGLVTVEVETEYMWGLLHPCILAGEAGYYLTTLSSAVQLLKNIRVAMETHVRQELTYMGELQGFMKVVIPDERCNNIITRTLPVRPTMTSKDVCAMISHRFKVVNPQNYSLYVLVKGREERVAEMDFPHQIRAHHNRKNQLCMFIFKRNNATFAWPVHLK